MHTIQDRKICFFFGKEGVFGILMERILFYFLYFIRFIVFVAEKIAMKQVVSSKKQKLDNGDKEQTVEKKNFGMEGEENTEEEQHNSSEEKKVQFFDDQLVFGYSFCWDLNSGVCL